MVMKLLNIQQRLLKTTFKNMEQKGLVYREKKQLPGGFRAYGIFLTEEGKKATADVYEIVNEAEEVAFQGFSEEEKETFMNLFSRVKENLEEA
jgi:DNA-binding MarR family transcriptional regulator